VFYATHREVLEGLEYIDELRPFEDRSHDSLWLNYETGGPPTCHIARVFGNQLGIAIEDVRPDCTVVQSLCDQFRLDWAALPRPWITINRRASSWTPNKDWPDEYWRKLIERLDGTCGFIEVGWPRDGCSEISGSTYISLVGRTNTVELIAAIAASDLHVGPISAPVHIAAATRRPSVVIYGGYEPPDCTMYEGNRALYSTIECSPCWLRSPCPYERRCLTMIDIEKVVAAIRDTWHSMCSDKQSTV
jgi:ADP-heptose:LPS heptosyltransferase